MELCSPVPQLGIYHYTKHELYTTWRMMNYRCYSDVHKSFKSYGGSGIIVCESWRWDNPYGLFNFVNDVKTRPQKHTLDRIDPYGNYELANCRWADKRTQQNNFKDESFSSTGKTGVVKTNKGKFIAQITLNENMVNINHYETFEEACSARKQAEQWKMELGDDEALKLVEKNIVKLVNGKRPYGRKTSKYYGVSYDKFRNYWKAQVPYRKENGKLSQRYLGRFDTEEEAYNAVLDYLEKQRSVNNVA